MAKKTRSIQFIGSPLSSGGRGRSIREEDGGGNTGRGSRGAGASLAPGARGLPAAPAPAPPAPDRTSGSAALFAKVAAALDARLRVSAGLSIEGMERALLREASRPLQTCPAMALVFAAANAPLVSLAAALRSGEDPERARIEALAALRAFARERERAAEAAAREAASWLRGARRIATVSQSGLVVSTLRLLAGRRAPEVWVAESAPAREGMLTARKLRAAGLRVRLFPDALLASAARVSEAAIVGADRLTDEGFVNKSGTLALALSAEAFGRTFVIVAEGEKYFPCPPVPVVLPAMQGSARKWAPLFEWIPYQAGMALFTGDSGRRGGPGRGAMRLHGGLIHALERIERHLSPRQGA